MTPGICRAPLGPNTTFTKLASLSRKTFIVRYPLAKAASMCLGRNNGIPTLVELEWLLTGKYLGSYCLADIAKHLGTPVLA